MSFRLRGGTTFHRVSRFPLGWTEGLEFKVLGSRGLKAVIRFSEDVRDGIPLVADDSGLQSLELLHDGLGKVLVNLFIKVLVDGVDFVFPEVQGHIEESFHVDVLILQILPS